MNQLTFLDPGMFRHRISLEEAQHTPDGLGGVDQNWIEVKSVWAHIEPIRAHMREVASQTEERISHRIYCRSMPGNISALRIKRGARVFYIDTAYDPDETGRYVLINAVEHSNG